MNKIDEAFDTFRKRLELSDTERADTISRHSQVRESIASGFDVTRSFLTGSYARHTKTKPLKDVDVFFELGPKEADRRKGIPADMLSAFRDRLAKDFGEDCVELGRRCVTVSFDKKNQAVDETGKVLSIDCVPAFSHSKGYEIPDRTLGKWILSNPEIHAEKATAKNKACDGRWVPLVKMLKAWNRHAGKPIKPMFLLEVMAQSLVDPPFLSYPSEVRRFFSAASDAILIDWADPANLGPPVSDQMTSAMRQDAAKALREAEQKAAYAMRLADQSKTGEAITAWRSLMGKYFPAS